MHAVYIPEVAIDINAEAARLKAILDKTDNVNIFISEGAGVKDIVARMEAEEMVVVVILSSGSKRPPRRCLRRSVYVVGMMTMRSIWTSFFPGNR